MDAKERKIRENLHQISREHGPDYLMDGTVTEVDSSDYFVDVELDAGGTLTACRLRAASVGNKSIDILPKVGSAVVLAKISDDDYLVLACDEIDDIRMTAGGYMVQINNNGIAVSKTGDSLKSIISDLVDQIQAIYAPKNVAAIALIKVRIGQLLQ